ncbi:hypothetical protein HanRHA438_Chr01g0019801 [Helianthus annuus]|uniref:Uncharacterized protein n=1 Tax=Helianthus annuus TaxID=4232 RepID=A0A9K3JU73_HELAN|nr:hypothetical protein HanXRQr2_Chr01g0019291 [Helianthus annuus]KAJ0611427.1 hypothetical protein HanHA300_Chr01g0015681 [Helianthus annuus]KAJ0626724.1 hypothetical protein HanHA89_Chr01g0017281 [Helianthus annuus]KAJ0783073.1 hypothetical protein HanLR1_Chr01g0016231 [Helianthus annuus]KAJ0947774.1 hypothetical protein HanRHA438_Chr01g0019801 [Helianthus annuus]
MKGAGHLNGQADVSRSTGLRSVKNGVSFLDVLTNKTHAEKEENVLVLDPAIFSLANSPGRRAVGRALGFRELRSLKSSLLEAGLGGVSIQYLGGLYVLITLDSVERLSSLLSKKDSWSRWFSLFQPWLGQALPYKRLTWVNILGVPPHLVSRTFFIRSITVTTR